MFGLSMDAELAAFELYLRRQNLKPKTIKQFLIYLRVLLQACIPFSPPTFEVFLGAQSQKYSAASLNKYVQTAKKYVEWKRLDFPKDLLSKFKESPTTRITLSDDEISDFLSLPPEEGSREAYKMTVFWSVVAYTGARPGEIAVLRHQHIDLSSNTLIIPHSKTGTGRVIKLSPLLLPIITEYIKKCPTDFLFPSKGNDYPIGQNGWNKDFKKRIKRLGIVKKVQPYSFRHSYATTLLSNDAALFAVQDILGHSDPKTTRIYYHGNLKAQEKAMAKDPKVRNALGGKELIKQTLEFMDSLHMDDTKDLDFSKILEAKKLLWDALILQRNN